MADFDLGGPSEQDEETDIVSISDGEQLKRAWKDERAAPEILAYQGELLERVKEQVEFQVGPQFPPFLLVCIKFIIERDISPVVVHMADFGRCPFMVIVL